MTQLYGALENLKDDVSYLVWSRWKNIFVSVQRAESESEQRLIRETYSMWAREKQTDSETLASSSSWSVLTPKRGIEELERLELWDSFLTPLMWLIGLSFRVGDGISTSFCLSTGWRTNTHTHTHADGRVYCFCLVKVRNVMWTEIRLWSHSPMKVLEMYSDTWLPERLISDRWDSSLFNILLNCGRMRAKQSEMCRFSKF